MDEEATQAPAVEELRGIVGGEVIHRLGNHELGPDWIRVRGGVLSQPIDLRLALIAGRPRAVGLRIDNGREVTSATLREIRLAELIGILADDYLNPGPPPPDGMTVNEVQLDGSWDYDVALHHFFTSVVQQIDPDSVSAKRGQMPSDDTLRDFAEVYQRELRRRPHGAIARTARSTHIARSTAYRWLEACRQRSFVSTPEEDQT